MGRGGEGPAELAQAAARTLDVAVVAVPFPAQGHLNQMLHLSRQLASRGLTVHFTGSTTHNRQARLRLNSWDLSGYRNIVFHDLPTPLFASPPPNSAVKFPAHLQPSFEATFQLKRQFKSLLRSLSSAARRVVVIHDSLMSFAGEVAVLLPDAESYVFHSVSAFALFQHLKSPLEGCFTAEFTDFIRRQYGRAPSPAARLFNTCRYLESEFVDKLSKEPSLGEKRCFALGPLNPVILNQIPSDHRHWALRWLDLQPAGSVVFVSFGTTTTMAAAQIREIALGLERSEQKFIWVLREADIGDIFSAEGGGGAASGLPEGFETRAKGVIVRDWAPQLEILAHKSTALFMSHCGWNSCMESLTMGVPMATWPMHSDQPRNAALLVELGVGVPVWKWQRREEIVEASAVDAAVRRVMVSAEGREIRQRAEAVGIAIRSSSSAAAGSELLSLISYITR
ncbi:zeatin O-glucosyltransferase-like [Wolffia australiana]